MSILFGKKTIVYLIVLFIDFWYRLVLQEKKRKEKRREKRGEYGLLRRKKKKKNREIKSQGVL